MAWSASRSPSEDFQLRFEEQAAEFFEPQLHKLQLSLVDIEAQDLPELEQSLDRVNELMQHPEQLGTFRAKFSAEANTFVIPRATTEAQLESGALPVLLLRKARILERIKLLRPIDQIDALRDEIVQKVDDERVRAELLRALDSQRTHQAVESDKLETETHDVESALEGQRFRTMYEVTLAQLKLRMDVLEGSLGDKTGSLDKLLADKTGSLEASLNKLEEKSVSKFDVVTIVFLVLAAIGGLLGAVLAIARWVTGA